MRSIFTKLHPYFDTHFSSSPASRNTPPPPSPIFYHINKNPAIHPARPASSLLQWALRPASSVPHLPISLSPSHTDHSSQLGGVTLTYSILYLSLYLHRTNRTYQHTLLSQQSMLLTSLLDPQQPSSSPSSSFSSTTPRSRSRYTIYPETLEVEERRKESLAEVLKERWNAEVEGMVRRVEETDWREVRERWERRGVNIWRNVVKD
jgi:MICOS complex subunit MIC12